jgi:hypothetical protein
MFYRIFSLNNKRMYVLSVFLLSIANIYSSDIKNNESRPQLLQDSLQNSSYEKMQALDLPEIEKDSVNPLSGKCFYCQKQNRLWYSNINDACSAAPKLKGKCETEAMTMRRASQRG